MSNANDELVLRTIRKLYEAQRRAYLLALAFKQNRRAPDHEVEAVLRDFAASVVGTPPGGVETS